MASSALISSLHVGSSKGFSDFTGLRSSAAALPFARRRNDVLLSLVSFQASAVGTSFRSKIVQASRNEISSLAIQVGALLTTIGFDWAAAPPALAVTGVNDEEDLIWVLIQLGISAFIYFIVAPPIIMNWLRIRWYKRGLLEMYLQFMFVFLFFPGVLVWAPFLNFRKFPRDPDMKYPWSPPEDPTLIKGGFLKYPWASPEDYE